MSCENVLRMAGLRITEEKVVDYASSTVSESTGTLLCTTLEHPLNNGGTNVNSRNEILNHFGVESVALPCTTDDIARYIEEGRGVIISVHCNQLYYGFSEGNDLHAVTVTSVKRDATGNLLGLYLCDSNGKPSEFYYTNEIEAALSGRKMNVTTQIIR